MNYFNDCSCIPITPTLPLTFDDSLTYYETLSALLHKVNELVKYIDGLKEISNDYTDTEIIKLNDKFTELLDAYKAELNSIVSNIETEIKEFKVDVNTNFTKIDKEFKNNSEASTAYTNYVIERYNTIVQEELTNKLGEIKIINFFTGESISIQRMFDVLAQYHLTNPLTVQSLIDKHKSINELIAYDKTYTEFINNAGEFVTA